MNDDGEVKNEGSVDEETLLVKVLSNDLPSTSTKNNVEPNFKGRLKNQRARVPNFIVPKLVPLYTKFEINFIVLAKKDD